MALYSVNDNIFIRRGDSGNVVVNGIPTDKNYGVYFSVVDENEDIKKEWTVQSNQAASVTFSFAASDTDDIEPGDYYYGIKICNGGMEDTLIPRTTIIDDRICHCPTPIFQVGEKFVEGV